MEILGEGAEARIEREQDVVRKVRPEKRYRHPDLDERLRKTRMRSEAKVLEKAPVARPELLSVDEEEMVVEMEYVEGEQLRDALSPDNQERLGRMAGEAVRELHDAGIVHGDLTTSNFLVRDGELVLIDFGLSYFSGDVEDRAVDLHLLKHALEAKHPDLCVFEHVMAAYEADEELLERFEEVELRGRYKRKGS